MGKKLVSIIMSVYNTEPKILDQAIKSILNQTYKNFEFIIIDDNSDENIKGQIESYQDARILFIQNKENLGLTKNLNKAIELSNGCYIARMDADDISHEKRIEKQVTFLNNNSKVGIVGTNAKSIGISQKKIKMYSEHQDIKAQLLINSPMIHPSIMIRKSLLNENMYNESYRVAQDYELWSRLIWKTEFSNIQEELLFYRLHEKQVSNKRTKDHNYLIQDIRKKMWSKISQNITSDELKLIKKSSSAAALSEKELETLNLFSNVMIEKNLISLNYANESLIKILSKNLDRAIYISTKTKGGFPKRKLKIKPKHYVNRFTIQKFFGFLIR